MSRKDKKETKEKFEKKVLRDLRRWKELNSSCYKFIEDKTNVIGKETYLVIKKDALIYDKDRKLLQEFLDTFINIERRSRIDLTYDKHFGLYYFNKASNFNYVPEHLRVLLKCYTCNGEIYTCHILKYFSDFLTTAERNIYKCIYVLVPKEESERRYLSKKLWWEGNAPKVLHEGKSAWSKIEHSYKRCENKKELQKALEEEPFFIF